VSDVRDARDLHDAGAGDAPATLEEDLPRFSVPSSGSGSARRVAPGAPAGGDGRRALMRLLLIVALVIVAAMATNTTNLLIVIVALIVMIMLHELGHFATAKWSGMKVTEYFLGFGPRIWSVRRGETEYGVKAIPAGGYVRIIGMTNTEEVDPADEARTYRAKPFHNRLAVGLAGSFMHFVMAFLLIWGMLVFVGAPKASTVSVGGFAPVSGNVDPARAAGMRTGDVVVSVNGQAITSADQLAHTISSHPGQLVTVVVERAGTRQTLVVTPQSVTIPASGGTPATHTARIGISIEQHYTNVPVGPLESARQAGVGIGQVVTGSVTAVGQRFSPHGLSQYFHQLTNAQAAQQASQSGQRIQSIYGAVRTATQGAQAGAWYLVEVLVSIIIFVGLLNLLPMLPLDGGHVAIAIYERIRSRRGRPYRADVAKLVPVAYAFVLFLGFIVVTSLYLDVTHPIANPFK
jgi:membrane-associated protease RseP (regulator of RpoE activity)